MGFKFFEKVKTNQQNEMVSTEKAEKQEEEGGEKISRKEAFRKKVQEVWNIRKKNIEEIMGTGKKENGSFVVDSFEISEEEGEKIMRSISDEKYALFESDYSKGQFEKISDEELGELEAGLETEREQLTSKESIKKEIIDTTRENRAHEKIQDNKKELTGIMKGFITELDVKRSDIFKNDKIEKAVALMNIQKELYSIMERFERLPDGLGAESAEKKEQKIAEAKDFIQKSMSSIKEIIDLIAASVSEDETENKKKEAQLIIKSIEGKLIEIN